LKSFKKTGADERDQILSILKSGFGVCVKTKISFKGYKKTSLMEEPLILNGSFVHSKNYFHTLLVFFILLGKI